MQRAVCAGHIYSDIGRRAIDRRHGMGVVCVQIGVVGQHVAADRVRRGVFLHRIDVGNRYRGIVHARKIHRRGSPTQRSVAEFYGVGEFVDQYLASTERLKLRREARGVISNRSVRIDPDLRAKKAGIGAVEVSESRAGVNRVFREEIGWGVIAIGGVGSGTDIVIDRPERLGGAAEVVEPSHSGSVLVL